MNTTRKVFPKLNDILDDFLDEVMHRVNAVKIGKIEALTANNTATVQIQYKLIASDGTIQTFPLLLDVPIFVLQGGGAFLEFPVAVGDRCLLLFNDREIDNWWLTEQVVLTNTPRKHDLSDGFALIGINSKANPLTLLGTCVRLYSGSHKMEFQNSSVTFSTWLGSFIDAIVGIVTVGSATTQTLDSTTQANLNNLKTQALELFGSS